MWLPPSRVQVSASSLEACSDSTWVHSPYSSGLLWFPSTISLSLFGFWYWAPSISPVGLLTSV